jgi:hypothetical protein
MSDSIYMVQPVVSVGALGVPHHVWTRSVHLRRVGPVVRRVGNEVMVSWKGDGLGKALDAARKVVAKVGSPTFVHGMTGDERESALYLTPERSDVVAEVARAMEKFYPEGANDRRGTQKFNLIGRGRGVAVEVVGVISEVLEKNKTELTHVWMPQLFPTCSGAIDFTLSGVVSADDSPAEFRERLTCRLPYIHLFLHNDNR